VCGNAAASPDLIVVQPAIASVLAASSRSVAHLMEAERFDANALDRVSELFLPDRQLTQYASLLEHLVDGG
jgi:hypothetical protein